MLLNETEGIRKIKTLCYEKFLSPFYFYDIICNLDFPRSSDNTFSGFIIMTCQRIVVNNDVRDGMNGGI